MPNLLLDSLSFSPARRRTKIIATLGPASSSPEVIASLVDAGVDVFRLNFSHGTQEGHAEVYQRVRAVAAKAGKHIAVLADLCGPKIRVGKFEQGGIDLETGGEVTVTVRDVLGKPGLIPCEYPELAQDVEIDNRILLDDGKLELRVLKAQGTEIACEVVQGGRLLNRKGMNLPGVKVSSPALTEKDRADATFAVRMGVDFVALSFVREAKDVSELRQFLANLGFQTPLIAKIEKPEAISNIGAILDVSDGIMIARGDLGVEMPAEEVPVLQQELIRLAISANRPVIVATQMLESMIDNARPTRAEVSDVAGAAMARTDAVMLSAETASGHFPLQAVSTMDRILRLVEGYQYKTGALGRPDGASEGSSHQEKLASALSRATSVLSRELQVRAVMVPTRTGRTPRLVSASRPAAQIVALSSSEAICRQLALSWGISPESASDEELQDSAALAKSSAVRTRLAQPGECVLLVWDQSPLHAGIAPSVSILTL